MLKGYSYDLSSNERKIEILKNLTLFISAIKTEAKILIIPLMQDLNAHFAELRDKLNPDDPLYNHATHQAAETENYLKATAEVGGRINDYKTFIVVKLADEGEYDIATQAKDALYFMFSTLKNDINAFMDVDAKDIPVNKMNHFRKLADNFFQEQNPRLALEPISSQKLQWLLRRMAFRGLNKDARLFYKNSHEAWQPPCEEISLAGNKYIRPGKRLLVNLFSGAITKKNRYIKIEHDAEEASYQTFLTITNIPEELEFPNCEWIYMLQMYNSQAEICIHIQNIEHRSSLKNLELKKRSINSQIEHVERANADIPADLWTSKQQSEFLEAELKDGRYPMTKASVTICLADDTPDGLEKKAANIKREYEDMNFIIERPKTDQLNLFFQFIPSTGFCVPDFIMKLTPMALASGIIGATRELGDAAGAAYIGTTGHEKKHVFLNMALACLTNRSASATFYGNLGTGKSFNANLLLYLHVLYGGYGLIFDPKGERSHWVEDFSVLKGLITVVTLSAEPKHRGKLDPFNIFRDDKESAAELAINLLAEMFKLKPRDREYTALLAAIKIIKSESVRSMTRLSEILAEFERDDSLYSEAVMLSRQIDLLKDAGMAQLLFGDGSEDAIRIDNRLNILQIQNLRLASPDTKKDDYTQEETLSNVLMMVMASFARRFIHSFPNKFKICLFDESWMLGKTAEGEKLMSYFGRMSRSLYAAMILNGHSVLDLPNEGIANTITYKFCFRTNDANEAKRMVKYIGLEETAENIQIIKNLRNAECLFQDLSGHIGILKFDAVFQDIIDVFSTTPIDAADIKQDALEAAEEYEDDPAPETDGAPIDIFAYEPI